MYCSTLLASFFALTACALPLAARKAGDVKCVNPGDCYQILDISASEPSGRPGSDNLVHFKFTLKDDSPKIEATTTCSVSWDQGTGGWPHDYIKCDDDKLRWSFSKFESITEWHMEATHDFTLDSKWGARSYANGTATRDDFDCVSGGSGVKNCNLKDDHVINLGIYAMIA